MGRRTRELLACLLFDGVYDWVRFNSLPNVQKWIVSFNEGNSPSFHKDEKMSKTKKSLEERIVSSANAALVNHKYVCPIDVLIGLGWLSQGQVQDWRRGRIHYLEHAVQANLNKITQAMKIFQSWAKKKGLNPTQTVYLARTAGPKRELRFSKSGRTDIERAYRTHYFSPELSEKKREKLQDKLSKAPELVVYRTLRPSQCSKCGMELPAGSLLLLEDANPLCMECAGMDDLIYVPAGNAKLTRRVKKYSSRYSVVVKFSRGRKRYERQGILSDKEAVDMAESECKTELKQ